MARASAPTFNVNGAWSVTGDGCRGASVRDGTLVISGGNSSSGKFDGADTRDAVSGALNGSESGHKMTIADPSPTVNNAISGPVERGASSLTTMLLAILAWLGWTVIHQAAVTPGAAAPVVFIDEFLASVFVGGLVGSGVGLLPLRFLTGGTLVAWRRGVWVAVFGLATFLPVQVLLRPTQWAVDPSTAPVVTALILFVGFGGASLAFSRYFSWSNRPARLPEKVTPVIPKHLADGAATGAVPVQDSTSPRPTLSPGPQ